jgi:hypothetical protein
MKVGNKITVTIPQFKGYVWEYKILAFVEDKGQGTVMLETLAITTPQGYSGEIEKPTMNFKRETFKDRKMVVEKQWFNQELTGRRIEYN